MDDCDAESSSTEEFAQICEEFDQRIQAVVRWVEEKVHLELLEDEDVLEAGIRIIAQPPGKRAAEHDAAYPEREKASDCDLRGRVADSESQ